MTNEYCALSNNQKLKLKVIRGVRGHQPNKRQHTGRKKSLNSQVVAIACQLSALWSEETNEEATEEQGVAQQ